MLGSRFPVPELVAVTGRSTSELWPEIEELERSGLLRVEGDQLRFSHDLVWQAVYDDLPTPVLVSAHADAAQRLDAAGASVVVVSEHVLRSVREDDDTAVGALHRAAGRVLDRAPGLAVTLLDAALEHAGPLDRRRRELACDRAGALLAAGRHPEAMSACRVLLDAGGGGPVASRLGEILTHAALAVGELDAALVDAAASSGEVSEDRLAVLRGYRTLGLALTAEAVDRRAERAEAWGRVGACFFRDVDLVGELGREALELARKGHDVAAEANALGMAACRCAAGWSSRSSGRPARARFPWPTRAASVWPMRCSRTATPPTRPTTATDTTRRGRSWRRASASPRRSATTTTCS